MDSRGKLLFFRGSGSSRRVRQQKSVSLAPTKHGLHTCFSTRCEIVSKRPAARQGIKASDELHVPPPVVWQAATGEIALRYDTCLVSVVVWYRLELLLRRESQRA